MSAEEEPTPMEASTEHQPEPEEQPEVEQNVAPADDHKEQSQQPTELEAPRRSFRSRKKVVKHNIAPQEVKETELPEGPGVNLGDIDLISGRIDKMKAADMLLKKLYRICFGWNARKLRCKKDLRKWSGFDEKTADADIEKRTSWIKKNCDVANVLKPMLGFLDLSPVGTKDELIDRLLEFLASPTDSGKEYSPFTMKRGSKRKRTKKSTKKSKKSGAPRKKSGYMVFLSEHRAEYKADNPDLSMIEVTQGLARQWNELDDDEKQEWKDKAASMPAVAPKKKGRKKPQPKKRRKKTPAKRQPSSDDESSDDDEPLGGENVKSSLDAAVKKIVFEGDLNTLTKKMVRKKLRAHFDEDVMLEHKAFIKDCMKKYSAEKMQEN